MKGWTLHEGDCIEAMGSLADASMGSVCTDPPYGIRFMGKAWDGADIEKLVGMRRALPSRPPGNGGENGGYRSSAHEAGRYSRTTDANRAFQEWCEDWGRECLRLLKPGGYLVSFGSPRTYHRLACGLEDAGFAVKDSLHWMFGSGFPKSLNLGDGYGTALKPAHEPIILAQKPLQGTYAANVARHGVGALNIDGCRVAAADGVPVFRNNGQNAANTYGDGLHGSARTGEIDTLTGRWPTNLLLTHSPLCAEACHPSCPVAVLDAQSGDLRGGSAINGRPTRWMAGQPEIGLRDFDGYDDSGGASRFYPTFRFEDDDFAPFLYVAKSSRAEREAGLRGLPDRVLAMSNGAQARHERGDEAAGKGGFNDIKVRKNNHPTVKPVQLMRWLVRLITPPGQTVLDPFLGSGTTGVAALMEGRHFVGIEREAAYMAISRRRLETAQPGLPLGA